MSGFYFGLLAVTFLLLCRTAKWPGDVWKRLDRAETNFAWTMAAMYKDTVMMLEFMNLTRWEGKASRPPWIDDAYLDLCGKPVATFSVFILKYLQELQIAIGSYRDAMVVSSSLAVSVFLSLGDLDIALNSVPSYFQAEGDPEWLLTEWDSRFQFLAGEGRDVWKNELLKVDLEQLLGAVRAANVTEGSILDTTDGEE